MALNISISIYEQQILESISDEIQCAKLVRCPLLPNIVIWEIALPINYNSYYIEIKIVFPSIFDIHCILELGILFYGCKLLNGTCSKFVAS